MGFAGVCCILFQYNRLLVIFAIFINPVAGKEGIMYLEVVDIDYSEHIQKVLDYIEEHLKSDIDNKKLAQIAGYSQYHFLRVFHNAVHLTPADYIRKRRISEIVRHMETGKRPIPVWAGDPYEI